MTCPKHGDACEGWENLSEIGQALHLIPPYQGSQGPAIMTKPEEDDPDGFNADRQAEREAGWRSVRAGGGWQP